ncbi:hypothetical protein B0T25DRAFT_547545 [Lasiosphaeria hispida]|uniref:Bacteriophage T5 Orf172 DNA-binding domain-containing protein n=1 Tax=Lasiosphaeria hispida TaxID=260671 RepID=A0AAJ0MC57_9PEZI|nr:hypothetical protein B0T25DRAFT_547545 [Lasiosphaeria hispida]
MGSSTSTANLLQPHKDGDGYEFRSREQLCTLLQIADPYKTCLHVRDSISCSHPIGPAKRGKVPGLLTNLCSTKFPSPEAGGLLQTLSTCVVCGLGSAATRGYHQLSAREVQDRWYGKLWDEYRLAAGPDLITREAWDIKLGVVIPKTTPPSTPTRKHFPKEDEDDDRSSVYSNPFSEDDVATPETAITNFDDYDSEQPSSPPAVSRRLFLDPLKPKSGLDAHIELKVHDKNQVSGGHGEVKSEVKKESHSPQVPPLHRWLLETAEATSNFDSEGEEEAPIESTPSPATKKNDSLVDNAHHRATTSLDRDVVQPPTTLTTPQPTAPPRPGFRPYAQATPPPSSSQQLLQLTMKVTGSRRRRPGFIYGFTRPSLHGMIKIGSAQEPRNRTHDPVANRLRQWQKQCAHPASDPVTEIFRAPVPRDVTPRQVEELVHLTLKLHRRVEDPPCDKCEGRRRDRVARGRPAGSGGGHDEWFEMGIEMAEKVVRGCVEFVARLPNSKLLALEDEAMQIVQDAISEGRDGDGGTVCLVEVMLRLAEEQGLGRRSVFKLGAKKGVLVSTRTW